MKYIIIIVAVLALLIARSIYEKKNTRKKLINRLNSSWGNVPQEEYSSEKYKSLQFYYNGHKGDNDIDDITWNDLDMDQIFMTVNNTCSSVGEEYLYSLLRKPMFNNDDLAERERLIQLFVKDDELRRKLQLELSGIGKSDSISVYEYMNRIDNANRDNSLLHYMAPILFVAAIALCFFDFGMGIISLLISIIYSVVTYFKRKMSIDAYFFIVKFIVRWLKSADNISKIESDELSKYTDEIKELYKAFNKFVIGSSLVSTTIGSGNISDIILDYIRILFHVDLIKFNSMLGILENKKSELKQLFEVVGFLDSMLAAASFRVLLGNYCVPELTKEGKHFIETTGIYHPMIDNPIVNSFKEDRSALITGSNASGKSTFIKTVAINAALAQTIHTVAAESYNASFFKIASSMALRDNLANSESYYMVEIKSLKRIMDMADGDMPLLCFVDEVLRGTNTLERIAASSRILYELAQHNVVCIAATHDIELTHILERFYSNYHFQEKISDNDIVFDYLLHDGRAISKNAIKLLNIIGFKKELTDNATDAANDFLERGEWSAL